MPRIFTENLEDQPAPRRRDAPCRPFWRMPDRGKAAIQLMFATPKHLSRNLLSRVSSTGTDTVPPQINIFLIPDASDASFLPPIGKNAGVAQLVEHFLAKEDVASSSLVTRFLNSLM